MDKPELISKLVSWCFKPSQPQRITSWLRKTFIKRYLVERTNMAEIRPEKNALVYTQLCFRNGETGKQTCALRCITLSVPYCIGLVWHLPYSTDNRKN